METKVSKVCERELPLENFVKTLNGYMHTCKECVGHHIKEAHEKRRKHSNIEQEMASIKKARLSEFSPRELMEELARRGYTGKLTYTITKEIDITAF